MRGFLLFLNEKILTLILTLEWYDFELGLGYNQLKNQIHEKNYVYILFNRNSI